MAEDSFDEPESVTTLREFMADQQAAEEHADLILGGGDANECTYKEGYMPRQAVFSCLTCVPQGNAGVCTACSLVCHDGHEVVELWTKRRFRCDCGNAKFGSGDCKLFKEKEAENKENAYNQNFLSLYCNCHKRCPNSEDEELGIEMLQCCICEDWFHESHLGLAPSEQVPRDDDGEVLFDDLICQSCVSRCSFLFHYPEHMVPPSLKANENGTAKENGSSNDVASNSRADKAVCKLKRETGANTETCSDKALFLDRNWRNELCRCEECINMYKTKGISFLLEETDTIQSYEEMAKQKRKTRMEQAEGDVVKMVQSLEHVGQIEFLHGLNDMATELTTFLRTHGETGKTVTTADVHEFFDRLKQKRRKLN